jgi:hypothetical protein
MFLIGLGIVVVICLVVNHRGMRDGPQPGSGLH